MASQPDPSAPDVHRLFRACAASALCHAAIAATILALAQHRVPNVPSSTTSAVRTSRLIWLNIAGPGGGGGGGGNQVPTPPRRVELPGHDPASVPARKPPTIEAGVTTDASEEAVPDSFIIPAQTLASATASLPGAVEAPPGPSTPSRGPGNNGGAGSGRRGGDGDGDGVGLGPGRVFGVGDGPYRVGAGVTPPIELRRGTAQYTLDAMRARIEGSVLLECVVQTTGACDSIRVVRSLDTAYGLDHEAVNAARLWRFRPGTRQGRPVPVLVTMEILFTLR
jgi:protein TonB